MTHGLMKQNFEGSSHFFYAIFFLFSIMHSQILNWGIAYRNNFHMLYKQKSEMILSNLAKIWYLAGNKMLLYAKDILHLLWIIYFLCNVLNTNLSEQA